MAGAVRLASPPLHSFAYAHRRSGVRLSFAVEPLSREFSSTAPNATKKPPERRLFYGRTHSAIYGLIYKYEKNFDFSHQHKYPDSNTESCIIRK